MSSLAFLVTELQSLASETRRKHPEIREAAEKSLAILRTSPEQATANLASDGPQSEDLLRPVFMGCATKNAKVVAISLGSLQRLIALKAVPQSAVSRIISTMSDAMSQGVDIQLKILQTLLSLVTNFPEVHGSLLGDALLLCFKLQESRIAVVSSTAAATLRQLVMFVVDKMVEDDKKDVEVPQESLEEVKLPDGTTRFLGPSAKDAFAVFEDLCLLANSEKPNFLKLDYLHKTFALELIESVLTNYFIPFRKHTELTLLLQHHLCPLLLKALSERPVFPLVLRCTRVVFLLLKQFSGELQTEAEVFLMLLIKIISDDAEGNQDSSHHVSRPQWMRVLAMEIMRGLCSDAELMRNVWDRYDGQDHGSKVFSTLITALNRLLTEKPALLGVSSQMFGVGVSTEVMSPSSSSGSGYGMDVGSVGGMAGMVANAASATVSGVVGMMGSSSGLSLQGSAMKLQCIDQLDKADAPPIPESYIYLLAVQCLISLCEGFASFSAPLYSSIVVQKPRAAGEAVIRAPPALDFDSLPPDEPSTKQLRIVRDIIEAGWPALLAAISFVISTNLSDELFADVLASYQAMTNVSGMLGLTTSRDAFFTSLSKFAVPSRVVLSVDSYHEPQTPRSASTLTENLGLSGPVQPPGLSERNMACLKILISSAMFLAGSLGESWFGILEAMQNADYVLTAKNTQQGTPSKRLSMAASGRSLSSGGVASLSQGTAVSSVPPTSSSGPNTHPLLSDLDPETMLNAMQRLFDASKNLEDGAFKYFVDALCRLSAEMIGMQTESRMLNVIAEGDDDETIGGSVSGKLSPHASTVSLDKQHRRRLSGIHIPRMRTGDFGITKLGGVVLLNIHRLIYRPPEVAWDTTTTHLLGIIRLITAPQAIRLQAARVLDDILIIVPRNLSNTGELQAQVQKRVLEVLAQQIMPESYAPANNTGTSIELRRLGLETLHQILQASGHTLVIGWETIFSMLESVCRPSTIGTAPSSESIPHTVPSPGASPTKPRPLSLGGLGLGHPSDKNYTTLIKIAFQSLTLVCDSVQLLSPEHLRLCISTLGQFGRQVETNIALTAAASLLWSVSDAIQAKRKDAEQEPEYSALWMFLLLEVLGLCTDERPEVRDGAIQTLFRTMQLYGATLSLETWDECIWKVTFPLIESLTSEIRRRAGLSAGTDSVEEQAWNESKTLAFHSIGSIFHDFLSSKIIHLETFSKAWEAFVVHTQDSVLLDNRSISTPALRCLEKAVKASSASVPEQSVRVGEIWQKVWEMIDHVGEAVLRKNSTTIAAAGEATLPKPFTQDSLVAFVDVIQCTRSTSRMIEGVEWPLERLTRLMAILKGVLTYPHSPDYRPDIDALPPVQTVVMSTVAGIDLSGPGTPSLVMRDLSEYATLPFLAAFDVPTNPQSQTPQKRITYIALAKKTMPTLVDLCLEFKNRLEIYADGTLEAVLSAYSIPVKLKYDCPAPSKFGKDQPLWKTATASFLRIVKECAPEIKNFTDEISDERLEGIWRQVIDVFRGGILADCTAAESFPLHVQEEEENFDLALIAALEIDVVPHLGDRRLPDSIVTQLAKVLAQGSRLYESDYGVFDHSRSRTPDLPQVAGNTEKSSPAPQNFKVDIERHHGHGSTDPGALLPRERFSYWCFDLLFLICSDVTKDQEHSRRRLAALSLPALINRCKTTLVGYVADEALRGNLPFPRAREDELLYVLRKLLELRLWPGSLWAALSTDPTTYCVEQPSVEASTPSVLIADAVKRSSVAHLFHFYSVLCEIASIPRKTPSTWIPASSVTSIGSISSKPGLNGHGPQSVENHSIASAGGSEDFGHDHSATHLDARVLARDCLKVVGKEMGVS